MTANDKILNRELANSVAKAADRPISVMEDMADYGSNLIVRLLSYTADGAIANIVPIAILGKQVLSTLDGITVLLRSGCFPAALPLARALWEAGLQLSYVLQHKPSAEQRAKFYWVAHLRRQLRRFKNDRSGSELRTAADAAFPSLPWRDDEELEELIATVEEQLGRPEFKTLAEQAKDSGRPFWAAALGCNSFEQMARELARWPEYEILYRHLSSAAHGMQPGQHVGAGEPGEITIRGVRDPDQHQISVVLMAPRWAMRAYSQLLVHYRPEELNNYKIKCARDWIPGLK